MKAAIYNPYFDTLGGGERYTISFAKVLIDTGWEVDVEWKDIEIGKKLESRFGMDLKGINFIPDIKRGDGYDLCFWVSDGSIPMLKSRKNFLHFQVPFHDVKGRSLLNKMKLYRINEVICNSKFTKTVIDKEFGIESIIIYPPVDVDQIKPKRKENLILSVGRFSQILQSKGQDILIKKFKSMVDKGLQDWKLILAGGVEIGAGGFLEELQKMASGYPVEIIKSPDFTELKDLYGKAKIFWSASGFGVSEQRNPEKVEHFGMSLVEAMAGGAVPLAYVAGGHKEIITNGDNGYLWESTGDLDKKTKLLIDDKILWRKLAQNGTLASKKFSYEKFGLEVKKIL